MENVKSYIGEKLKDIDGNGVVTFYFSAFGNKDSDGDITVRGAFSKTIVENRKRIKHVLNHSTWEAPPGVISDLGEDDFGAWCRSKLMLGTKNGLETWEMYKAGAITEHSFRYDVIKSYIENAGDRQLETRYITEYKLWEVSSLYAWGANPNTPMISVKSESDMIREIEEAIKAGKLQPDQLIKSLEKLPGFTGFQPKSTGTEPITCEECGHEFDYNSVPEVGMGYVKCPKCGKPVWQKNLSGSVGYLRKHLTFLK